MSEENEKKSSPPDDLDFDWNDDALSEWEGGLDNSAEAKSAPMPQASKDAPARPLYQPPSPDETFARRPASRPTFPRHKTSKGMPKLPKIGEELPKIGEEKGDEATKFTKIPQDLIDSLLAETGNERPTRPPDADTTSAGLPPPAVELDLDGLLDGMEVDTRDYPEDQPPPKREKPPEAQTIDVKRPELPQKREDPLRKTLAGAGPPPPPPIAPPTKMPAMALTPPGRPPLPPSPTRPGIMWPAPKPGVPKPGALNPGGPAANLGVPKPLEAKKEEAPAQSPPVGGDAAPTPLRPPPGDASIAKPVGLPAPRRPLPPPRPIPPEPTRPGIKRAPPKPIRPEVPRPGGLAPQKPIEPDAGASAQKPLEPAPVEPGFTPDVTRLSIPFVAESTEHGQKLDGFHREPTRPGVEAPPRTPVPPVASEPSSPRVPLPRPIPTPVPKPLLTPVPKPFGSEPMPIAGELDDRTDPSKHLDQDAVSEAETSPPPADLAPREPVRRAAVEESMEFSVASAEADGEDWDAIEAMQSAEMPVPAERARATAESSELTVASTEDDIGSWNFDDEATQAGELNLPDLPSSERSLSQDDESADFTVEATEGEDDDEDWEDVEAQAEQPEQAAARDRSDRGALAARRSVRSRKPRDEVFPMVGEGTDALKLRKRLLTTLAQTRDGGRRARLLVGAAELSEQLGDSDEARELYRSALDADPTDVVALRALRRDALARSAWDELAELFAKEAQLVLSPRERALALTGLAEVRFSRLDDAYSAERAAQRALELEPRALGAALLLAEARFAQGKIDEAAEAYASAAGAWNDPEAQAALLVERARSSERNADVSTASALFTEAAEHDPEALDVDFGIARTTLRSDPRTAVAALGRIAARLSGACREAILTRASRVGVLSAKDPKLGVELLAEAHGIIALRARADAAAASNDTAAELTALSALASAAGGTARALALVRMAEALAAGGDLDGADAALRDASLADGSLGTIRVVREVIARRAGDMSRLVSTVEAGGALSAAARMASGNPQAERELLTTAAKEGHSLVAVDVLTLDVAASQHDADAVDGALRRQAERVPPEQRVGSLLALADRCIARGDFVSSEALLQEARQLGAGDPLVLRPLARLLIREEPTQAAALWLEESSVASGTRAAYAATEAGRILQRSGGEAGIAYRRALDTVRGYGPAAWQLKPLAIDNGDPLTLGMVHEELAECAAAPSDVAGHLVRAALLRADSDPAGAGAILDRARAIVPDDADLLSLIMRLAGTTSPSDRAALLVTAADKAPPLLARIFRLQAAAAYEDAEQPAAAAVQYRTVAEAHENDPIVRVALDAAEIDAGEIARVAQRRFAAVKESPEGEQRVHALERLADLDLHDRKDPGSAMLSLQSILEIAPGHLPSLRALQRYFAEHQRSEEAIAILDRMAENLAEGPDVTAHLRLAWRLALVNPEAPGNAADDILLRNAPRATVDFWLAPRLLAAARARGENEQARFVALHLAELLAGKAERAAAQMRAAELWQGQDWQAAAKLLREAVEAAPDHPGAAEALAEACEHTKSFAEAAEAWELAAGACQVRARAADLYHRAGVLWQDKLSDIARARAAYEKAAERNVTHADVFERLRVILSEAGDRQRLAELFGQRLSAGGEAGDMVDLYTKQAQLYTDLRDLANAKSALRAALAFSPEHVDALRKLADLCIEDEDWRGAAEVLIRIARVRKEREELRWVFFTLGDIYDQQMPDPQRAEAAFQRVLKLLPQDVPAMERLAVLYEREGQLPKAAEMRAELSRLDVDPDKNRAHRLKLAEIFERMNESRRSEQVLEDARKNASTDLQVLRALADFYKRQGAANALTMHLNRAVSDFRNAIKADLGDAAAWPGLVEVLGWRGDLDAGAAAASAAQAIGIVDVEMSKLLDVRGAAPGKGPAAAFENLDELLAPPPLPAPLRAVFRLAGETLERSLPFELAAYRAEKVGGRDTTIRPIAMECARWFGIAEPQIYITSAAPRVCVPVFSNPVTLLIGSELIGITDDREKLFVLVRALKIAQAQLSVVVRAQPQEVLALMGGLVQSYDPHHQPRGIDPTLVGDAARRIAKNVNKRTRDALGPMVFEMAGRPGYDPSRLAMASSEWGNRTALIASGSAPAAFSALAKLSGERELPNDPAARIAMLTRFPEASSLLNFAISDTHFEARRRAGQR